MHGLVEGDLGSIDGEEENPCGTCAARMLSVHLSVRLGYFPYGIKRDEVETLLRSTPFPIGR